MSTELVMKLQQAPYLRDGSSLDGVDCWGVVEVWYRERLGIDLADRRNLESSALGCAAGYQIRGADWVAVDDPRDDDVVVMHGVHRGERIENGHVGVLWKGAVVHAEVRAGCVYQPLKAPLIARRIAGFYRHRSLL